MITRRFLVAPALARLVCYQGGSTPVIEGFFEQRSGRSVLLRVNGRAAHLVLSTPRSSEDPDEAATAIPLEHATVLLASCPGKISFEQTTLVLGEGQEALVRCFKGLNAFATVSVSFSDSDMAARFVMPVWFGSEVTDDSAYANQGLALDGIPRLGEVLISDSALNAVMDLVEKQPKPAREQPLVDAESAAASSPELSQETLSALTEGMERAITGAAEDEAGAGTSSANDQAERQTGGTTVSRLARSESSLGRYRHGFPTTRTGNGRDHQTQDAAAAS